MLGIVLASSIAKAPQAQPRLAPTRITNSGLSCVSTAVDLKTATCNTNCNAEGYDCPEACFCLPAFSKPEDDLSLAMTADDLDRISTELNTGKAVTSRLTSLSRKSSSSLKKACSSVSDTVEHSWCDKNCNAEPPNCVRMGLKPQIEAPKPATNPFWPHVIAARSNVQMRRHAAELHREWQERERLWELCGAVLCGHAGSEFDLHS